MMESHRAIPQPARSELPAPSSPWRPLANRIFRNLLAAELISDIGAFMQSVGAAVSKVISHRRSCAPESSASQATVREYSVESWLGARMLTRCLPDDRNVGIP